MSARYGKTIYILCLKNAKAILSYETALHIHELQKENRLKRTFVPIPHRNIKR